MFVLCVSPYANAQGDPSTPDCKNGTEPCAESPQALTPTTAKSELQSFSNGLKLLGAASTLSSGSMSMGPALSFMQTLNDQMPKDQGGSKSADSMLKLLSAANSFASGSGGFGDALSVIQTLNSPNGEAANSPASEDFSRAISTFNSISTIAKDLNAASSGQGSMQGSMSMVKAGADIYKLFSELRLAAEEASHKKKAEEREANMLQKKRQYKASRENALQRKAMIDAKKKLLQDKQNQVMNLIQDKTKKRPQQNLSKSPSSYPRQKTFLEFKNSEVRVTD